jgi:hypothetical protein
MNPVLKWYLRTVLARPIIRAVDWTPEERNAFDLFCRTSCGIKLFEFLRQIVANATFNAVYRNSVSQNAAARGMQDMLAVLHRLRCFPAIQEESDVEALADSESAPGPDAGQMAWRPIGGRGAIG